MSSLASTGLVRKSTAPPFIAWTLSRTSTKPVMKTIDRSRSVAVSASCKSSPVRPGIRTSSSRQHGPS